MPGVRLIPGSAASSVPDSQFGKLQQRVGELFGKAKDEVEDHVNPAVGDIRDTAQKRFAELSEKGRDAVENQVHNLQDAAHDLTAKFQDKTQDVQDAVKDVKQTADDKVRRV